MLYLQKKGPRNSNGCSKGEKCMAKAICLGKKGRSLGDACLKNGKRAVCCVKGKNNLNVYSIFASCVQDL